ncbi:MAG: hypothetical protein JNL82_18770 [Myxococcales bacterium]|nr:hypothetical protein [Myxococcales bacterium]
MAITLPAVWCPARIDEFVELAADMIFCFGNKMYAAPLWDGGRRLGEVEAATRLYLLCHAHSDLSKFSMDKLAWTGEEMAALLQDERLRTTHRHLELLVCHAGSSFGTRAAIARARQIQAEYVQAFRRGDEAGVAAATRKHAAMRRPGPEPYTRPGQMIPLAGELYLALKRRGYDSLLITSYMRPVSKAFTGGQIEIDVPPKIAASKVPQYTSSWRTAAPR